MSVHPPFLSSLLSFLPAIFGHPRFCFSLCSLLARQTFPVRCDLPIDCRTLAAAGYCPKSLRNPAPPASERMNQNFDLKAWKARMARCVQILDDSSVASCPLPRRTKSREGVLKRQFHLQSVHRVVYTNGTKRDRPDAAAEDKVPTAPYRCKRRCVNQAGPNPADALLSTMGHCFIDETAEIIKPQAFSRIPRGLRVA
jgi:hypothetical protein